ncbi:MAG: ABC transporter permease [Alphaproteobacteria bacterium]
MSGKSVSILDPFRVLWEGRKFILRKTRQDLRFRYANSLLGMAWVVIMPTMFLALYATVQILIYRAHRPDVTTPELVLMMFSGIMAIFGLTEAANGSSGSLTRDKTIMQNTMLPSEVLVAQSATVGFVTCLIGIGLSIVLSLILDFNKPTLLFAPLVLFMQYLFVVGFCWIVSLVAVLIRDIQFILRFLTLGLIICSPIGYTVASVPPHLKAIVYANPMSYFLVNYQSLIVFGEWPPLDMTVIMVAMSLGTFFLGYFLYARLKMALIQLA